MPNASFACYTISIKVDVLGFYLMYSVFTISPTGKNRYSKTGFYQVGLMVKTISYIYPLIHSKIEVGESE